MTIVTNTASSVVMQTAISQTQSLVTNLSRVGEFSTTVSDSSLSTIIVNNSDPLDSVPTIDGFTTNVTMPDNVGLITLVGNLGSTSLDKCLLVDPSTPISYAGFATKIKRLDYTNGWPPVITAYITEDIQNDWAIRDTLSYS